MNIAFDLRPIMSGNISGVETYTRSVLDELIKNDTENTYILYTNSHANITENLPKYKNAIYVNTKYPSKLFNIFLRLFKWPKLDKLIQKECGKKVDIFFCPDPRPAPLKKAKKIIVVHDLCFKHFPEFFSKKSRIWFKYLLNFKRELKESKKIIAVSSYTKDDLVKTFEINPDKISVIHEGGGEHLQRGECTRSLPENYFLMLSTIEPRKNTNNAVKAFKKANLKNVSLVIAGKKNEKIFSDYKLEEGDNVEYIGFVEESEKASLIKNAKGFVYLSLFEGFGLPATEAMYFQVPTLVSNTTSLKEIGEKYALLADPEDIDDIAEKMKQLLHHKQIKPPYSWQKCGTNTLDVINYL
jgi:glycosyltransferase involved in cell wall biosynthesis